MLTSLSLPLKWERAQKIKKGARESESQRVRSNVLEPVFPLQVSDTTISHPHIERKEARTCSRVSTKGSRVSQKHFLVRWGRRRGEFPQPIYFESKNHFVFCRNPVTYPCIHCHLGLARLGGRLKEGNFFFFLISKLHADYFNLFLLPLISLIIFTFPC